MDLSQLSLWASLIAALGYLLVYSWREGHSAPRSLVKTLAVALLPVAGIGLGAPVTVLLGLGLGALGDFCLSRQGRSAFLAGMASFALGHLCFAVFFAAHAGAGFALWQIGALIALLGLAASTELWLAPFTGALRGPVRAYVGVITIMAICALLPATMAALLGAGLFLMSDLLLAIRLFRKPGPQIAAGLGVTLWICYWSGQFLILQAALGLISAG